MIDGTLAALADPTRRQLVERLSIGPCRAGELAEVVQMSRPALSRHLRVLRESGLAEEQRDPNDGRGRIYVLQPNAVIELRDWLADVSAMWSGQLDAFAQYVDGHRDA
ncbi:MAG: ArsR/SmtB family transcription factor [Myxococcota bacterium]